MWVSYVFLLLLYCQVPSREIDKAETRFWTHWNRETKQVRMDKKINFVDSFETLKHQPSITMCWIHNLSFPSSFSCSFTLRWRKLCPLHRDRERRSAWSVHLRWSLASAHVRSVTPCRRRRLEESQECPLCPPEPPSRITCPHKCPLRVHCPLTWGRRSPPTGCHIMLDIRDRL